MKSILDILTLSSAYLKDRGIENPRRQAEDLISDALDITRVDLYVNYDRPLTEAELDLCRKRLARRVKGEPLAYIHGEVTFYGCQLLVNKNVLIPRPETEILVDKIVSQLAGHDLKDKVLWDVCCGSGCLGIALKKRFPDLRVILSDLSPEALAIAKQNAERNAIQVEFRQGDLLAPFEEEKADYFVCNPPYIAEHEFSGLDKEVSEYEPKMALVSGSTGLEIYHRLADDLPSHLSSKAKGWLEIGYSQGETVKALFQEGFWTSARVEKDWSGHDRFFFLEAE
jgi:release factor glutamine methyltransferase